MVNDDTLQLIPMTQWDECIRRPRYIRHGKQQKGYRNELARGAYQGIEWYVGHNDIGFRTGYVKVRRAHPWWHMPYDYLNNFVDVHGGLTYAAKGPPGMVPLFSYVWWIGFDCGHAWDAPDKDIIDPKVLESYELTRYLTDGRVDPMQMMSGYGNTVRTQEFAQSECLALCEQVLAASQ